MILLGLFLLATASGRRPSNLPTPA
jgi:hypothetical protein